MKAWIIITTAAHMVCHTGPVTLPRFCYCQGWVVSTVCLQDSTHSRCTYWTVVILAKEETIKTWSRSSQHGTNVHLFALALMVVSTLFLSELSRHLQLLKNNPETSVSSLVKHYSDFPKMRVACRPRQTHPDRIRCTAVVVVVCGDSSRRRSGNRL